MIRFMGTGFLIWLRAGTDLSSFSLKIWLAGIKHTRMRSDQNISTEERSFNHLTCPTWHLLYEHLLHGGYACDQHYEPSKVPAASGVKDIPVGMVNSGPETFSAVRYEKKVAGIR